MAFTPGPGDYGVCYDEKLARMRETMKEHRL